MSLPNAVVLPKFVVENRVLGFDFSKKTEFANLTDSIASATIAVVVGSGDGLLVIGSPSITGFVVSARFSGGTQGVAYEIACVVTTAAGSTIEGYGVLQVN